MREARLPNVALKRGIPPEGRIKVDNSGRSLHLLS